MKNIDKWNYYLSIINGKINNLFSSIECPKELWEVTPNGKIKTLKIIGLDYIDRTLYFSGKTPTREDVSKLATYSVDFTPETENVCYSYEYHYETFKSSGAVRILEACKKYYKNIEDAQVESDRITEKIKNEEILLANGHVRCQRCKKVVPNAESIKHTIIGRTRKPVFNSYKGRYEDKACITQDVMTFCSGECAGNEQMSREG